MKLEDLKTVIRRRIEEKTGDSYTFSLYKEGLDRVIQKVGEEAVEVVIAAKGNDKKRIIEEIADLYFMSLLLLVCKDIELKEIWDELERRKK